jgi:hypothetical protein
MKTVNQIRQGDVLLTRVAVPATADRVFGADGQALAGIRIEGERTGHAHELPGRVYQIGDRRLVMLERPTPITHPEHAHVEVPAGWWEVTVQREHVPDRTPARRRD